MKTILLQLIVLFTFSCNIPDNISSEDNDNNPTTGENTEIAVPDNSNQETGTDEQEKPGEDDGILSILFIGNSFTMDSVSHLPGLLAAAGIDKVHMIHMYYGGRLVSKYHSEWSTFSDYKCYECTPGSTEWVITTGKTLKEVTESQKWDIVTIQEHTGNSAAWTWNHTAKSDIIGLINDVKISQNGHCPEFHYIMSQAYFNMDKIGKTSKPYITWTDQNGMYETIVAFAKNVMAECGFDGLIATGTMLQNLRTSSIDNEMNLTRDGYHMDTGISRYGAACTVFESIITPEFGIDLDGNSYRYDVSNTDPKSYCTPVTDQNSPIAIEAARQAISKPFEITDLSSF